MHTIRVMLVLTRHGFGASSVSSWVLSPSDLLLDGLIAEINGRPRKNPSEIGDSTTSRDGLVGRSWNFTIRNEKDAGSSRLSSGKLSNGRRQPKTIVTHLSGTQAACYGRDSRKREIRLG